MKKIVLCTFILDKQLSFIKEHKEKSLFRLFVYSQSKG
jgi:hypothetical protein